MPRYIFMPLCSTHRAFHNLPSRNNLPSAVATPNMSEGDYRVADISLADFGRREIDIAEHEVGDSFDKRFRCV